MANKTQFNSLEEPVSGVTWKTALATGIEALLDFYGYQSDPHVRGTPMRVAQAFAELFSGVGQDPAAVLTTCFEENHYDQMITVCNIDFVSICAHHLLPFHGQAHFAYLPDKQIVGLSKIPRMVEILARRPQIQERLTQQLATVFQETVKPRGCAIMVEAWHACVGVRGVRKPGVSMRTTALTGLFLSNPAAKEEFLLTALRGNGK